VAAALALVVTVLVLHRIAQHEVDAKYDRLHCAYVQTCSP